MLILHPNEEIKSIQGYEGLYSITSFGRVWSHSKIRRGKNDIQRTYKAKFLKLNKHSEGYLQVDLCKESKCKQKFIHRLVAQAFIPNPLNLPQVNHKDGNKQNNYAGTAVENYTDGNLEWCTRRKNNNHAMENGLIKKETSKYHGVYYRKTKKRVKPWCVRIKVNGKRIYLGHYKTKEEGCEVYNRYIIENNLNRPFNKGVEFNRKEKDLKPWCVVVYRKCIGVFSNELEAAKYYNTYVMKNILDLPLNIL